MRQPPVCANTPAIAICASFRASSLIGSSGRLIIMAQTSPYLSWPPAVVHVTAYQPHSKKRKLSCVLYAHSQFLCILGSFNETFAQPDICAIVNCSVVGWVCFTPLFFLWRVLYLCTCELRWRSTEFVLLPCCKALSHILAAMNCSVLALSAVFCSCLLTWSEQWHIVQPGTDPASNVRGGISVIVGSQDS